LATASYRSTRSLIRSSEYCGPALLPYRPLFRTLPISVRAL
jgi:hypothetical protein